MTPEEILKGIEDFLDEGHEKESNSSFSDYWNGSISSSVSESRDKELVIDLF